MTRQKIRELIVDDHEIDLETDVVDLITKLQKVVDDPQNVAFDRIFIEDEMDFESEYAKIKIKGERMETDKEMQDRLGRNAIRESNARARRQREYEFLKKEFGE